MQITLDQNEIETAIASYARGLIHIDDSQPVGVEIHVGRGNNGHTASLSIGSSNDSNDAPAPKASKVTRLSQTQDTEEDSPTEAEVVELSERSNKDSRFSEEPTAEQLVAAEDETATTAAPSKKSLFSKG
jgi:hypothetical protein